MTISCIYVGELRHRRFTPIDHRFRYPIFMLYLDLSELPHLFDGNPLWSASRPSVAWFRRADHVGSTEEALDQSVRDLVQSRIGRRPAGPIRLLTHLRYFGYGFNPVSFYYCFESVDGVERVDAVVAEINNTPWGEQYCYVVDGSRCDSMAKSFHISPFMDMDQSYRWRFSAPSDQLAVQMESHTPSGKIFDATLQLRREPLSGRALNTKLVTYPLMTAQVMVGIYWQALKLWCKKTPYFSHPDGARSIKGAQEPR